MKESITSRASQKIKAPLSFFARLHQGVHFLFCFVLGGGRLKNSLDFPPRCPRHRPHGPSSNVAVAKWKSAVCWREEGSFHLPPSHRRTPGVSRNPETPQEKFKDKTQGKREEERTDARQREKADIVVKRLEEHAANLLDVGGARWSEVWIFHLYPV